MWTSRSALERNGCLVKVELEQDARVLSFQDVLTLWRDSQEFRHFFIAQLQAMPFEAFRWETPGVTRDTLDRRFEYVVFDSPGLGQLPDMQAFAKYFRTHAENDVAVFPNVGKDAVLIVPCPLGNVNAYGHLAAFVRTAPEHQRHSLWQRVGEEMCRRLSRNPIWLSTAGAGVSWLHVRIDDYPKYYGYRSFRSATFPSANGGEKL